MGSVDPDDMIPDALLDQGLQALRDRLGPTWSVTVKPDSHEFRGGSPWNEVEQLAMRRWRLFWAPLNSAYS